MLTKNQFALLSYIAARPAGEPALSQRAIAQGTGKALGTVNGMVKELSAMGCLDGANRITDAGLWRRAVPGGQRRHYGGGHELALCPPVG
ncbi:MAG: winged helix-turn-helix domain-containing protein [Oscillospiraceae bacterium]